MKQHCKYISHCSQTTLCMHLVDLETDAFLIPSLSLFFFFSCTVMDELCRRVNLGSHFTENLQCCRAAFPVTAWLLCYFSSVSMAIKRDYQQLGATDSYAITILATS